MAVVVETAELWQTVVASVVAGIGITTVFSIAIWGASRYVDLSVAERRGAAFGAAVIGVVALAATLAAAAVGIVVMTSK
jgi:hypothetical protein